MSKTEKKEKVGIGDLFGVLRLVWRTRETPFRFSVSSGRAVITGYRQCLLPNIEIPVSLYGAPVDAIGERAFLKCDFLQKVIFRDGDPDEDGEAASGAARIEANAFSMCLRLKHVILSDSVTYIGKNAFSSCENLFALEFGSGLRTIDDRAFAGCKSLRELIIPEGTETIGYESFIGCGLVSVQIPESVVHMTRSAFENCDNLTEIYVRKDSYADRFLSKSAFFAPKLKRKS